MAAKFTPPVRHFILDDPRRAHAQTYRDLHYIRRVHAVNAALRPWMPLVAFAGVIGLYHVALYAIPALWSALCVPLGAVGAALS